MIPPPAFTARVLAGIVTPGQAGHIDPYFQRLLKWLSFKQATGALLQTQ